MALYTPPSLPRTPSSCAIRTSLPSIPPELLTSWSACRPARHTSGLPTPPLSAALPRLVFQPRSRVPSLPPIAHFDRQLSTMQPITPPYTQDPSEWARQIPPRQTNQPSPVTMDDEDDVFEQPFQHKPSSLRDASHVIDWFDVSPKRPASFVAEKTCEMVCYLWFSSSVPSSTRSRSSQIPSPPYSPESPSSSSPLQFNPSSTFVQFMQKVLETTQVSQSVVVLSLHYIWRLKERNRFTAGLPGSEFRIAVAAMMMANKFLDDNTYTNKTWSEVSGIDLNEINRMEREFLMGVDFSLYVSGKKYESWLNLLKGLVLAKESESQKWRRSRTHYRNGHRVQPTTSTPAMRTTRSRCYSTTYRARSTSPVQFIRPSHLTSSVARPHLYINQPPSPSPNSGSKRSAADAFSPTSTSFNELPPLKRPTGMTLHIPENGFTNGSNSASPLEPLQSFAKMSLSSSSTSPHNPRAASSTHSLPVMPGNRPQTLVAAYRVDRPVNVPQHLYYYSLAGSSLDTAAEQEKVKRKARLRCFQPPPLTNSYPPPPPYMMPVDVQSASVSPHGTHMIIRQAPLPHINDAIWSRKLPNVAPYISPADSSLQLPPLRETSVPSAPFANAGPPGLHFYASSNQRGSPVYPYNWSYDR